MAAKIAYVALLALLAFQVNGQLSVSLDTSVGSAFGDLGNLRRNILSRFGGAAISGIRDATAIGSNGIEAARDGITTGNDVIGSLARTGSNWGINGIGRLADSGSRMLNLGRTAVGATTRIGQDLFKTGLKLAQRGVDLAQDVATNAINFGAGVAKKGFNVTANAVDAIADGVVNAEARKTALLQGGLNTIANASANFGVSLDDAIAARVEANDAAINRVAENVEAGINNVANGLVNRLADVVDNANTANANANANLNINFTV